MSLCRSVALSLVLLPFLFLLPQLSSLLLLRLFPVLLLPAPHSPVIAAATYPAAAAAAARAWLLSDYPLGLLPLRHHLSSVSSPLPSAQDFQLQLLSSLLLLFSAAYPTAEILTDCWLLSTYHQLPSCYHLCLCH